MSKKRGSGAVSSQKTVELDVDLDAGPSRAKMKEQQNKLRLTSEGPIDADTKDFCGAFAALDMDNSWDDGAFSKGFKLQIRRMDDDEVQFDMIGIDPPLANAIRRILIAEVETVAISRVTIHQNTGVIHDENLAHRLGLVPIRFEPNHLEWKPKDSEFGDRNSVLFKLHAICTQEEKRKSIYSKDLKWVALNPDQEKLFASDPPRPVVDDILITQLRAGQEIECECYCEKNIGKEHAKWSPVCTAYYKLLPSIELTKPIVGEQAQALKDVCPMGVFDVEDLAGKAGKTDKKRAVVANPRSCTTCRECIDSFPGEASGLVLGKLKNHYLFSIESTGSVPAPLLFQRAVAKLKQKCETAKEVLSSKWPKDE